MRTQTGGKGTEKGRLVVDKELTVGSLLILKRPALFIALLPVLAQRFPCYAIVRNPLSVLASWNNVDHRVRKGHSRGAEPYDEVLRASWLLRKTASHGSCSCFSVSTSAFPRRSTETTSFATRRS